ncbi:MAG TPA: SRPBCC domain-containing protein [Candidatus Deferrimicrobium sp.]|nr:SRPBCC domain-containing protein [Candidatus Deferrimicrobium sp.]
MKGKTVIWGILITMACTILVPLTRPKSEEAMTTSRWPQAERVIYKQVVVKTNVTSVWRAWTTREGIKSFFAPDCRIELKVSGAYEMYFDLTAAARLRGGEGCRIQAIQPQKMLSFTWNAPPHLPEARSQFTSVVIRLQPLSDSATQVTLIHSGWGDGGEWDQAFEYFTRAWGVVLYRLQVRFEQGPIDWANPPR